MKKFLKKSLIVVTILLSSIFATTLSTTQSTYADDIGPSNHSGSTNGSSNSSSGTSSDIGDCSRTFLGMAPWYCGVKSNPQGEEELSDNIRTIAFNIFVDIGILATYLIIAYVIYGGYLYMFSSGDPGKAMAGRKTLARAFIGLAIVMLANIILSTIRAVLIGNKSFQDCNPLTSTTECVDTSMLINQLINWFIGVAGLVAFIFVVIGGVSYMTSRGDPGKLQKAKSTILYALIGLIIVALSWAISTFVYNILKDNSDFEEYDTERNASLVQYTAIAQKSS